MLRQSSALPPGAGHCDQIAGVAGHEVIHRTFSPTAQRYHFRDVTKMVFPHRDKPDQNQPNALSPQRGYPHYIDTLPGR
jgi:hypothetical protein